MGFVPAVVDDDDAVEIEDIIPIRRTVVNTNPVAVVEEENYRHHLYHHHPWTRANFQSP